MREIILDTETTGLTPKEGHRIVEIGALELINRMPTGKTFHTYINPQRDMPEEAFKVHGISADFLKDKPFFHDIAKEFLNFIEDSYLVIHNAPFDMKFINAELQWLEKKPISMEMVIDTLQMARKKFPGAKNSLDALCKRFGISLAQRTFHGALLDAELLLDVYLDLKGCRQLGLGLKDKERNALLNKNKDKEENIKKIRKLGSWSSIFPSEKEKEKHKEMLDFLKNPIWKD